MSEPIKNQGDEPVDPAIERAMINHNQKVDEEKNPSGARSESPRPAQVEGLATARPKWRLGDSRHYHGTTFEATIVYDAPLGSTATMEIPVVAPDALLSAEDAALIVAAVNEYDSNQAKIEAATKALRGIKLAAQPIIRDPEAINTFAMWAAELSEKALALIESQPEEIKS